MYGKDTAAPRPNPIAPRAALAPQAPVAAAPAPALPGELTATLIREWGPVLKPTGIGLLVALHSFEETASAHPFFGWAHCTQTALAAYLDTSQDTIARYTNLLQLCGLLQVEEVETPRGKQKLYRVARGEPLPSLALLEYLVFEADLWTRKHTAWLAQGIAPLGPSGELARLTAIMARAYRVAVDARGLASIVEGARLTQPASYRPRKPVAAQQPALLALDPAPARLLSAPGGQAIPAASTPGLSGAGAPGGSGGGEESASGGAEGGQESALGGAEGGQESALGGARVGQESALGGVADQSTARIEPLLATESARGGAGLVWDSAPGGLGAGHPVNVESIPVLNERDENENDAGPGDDSAGSGEDADALLSWGTRALGDQASREWHRRCLEENGAERYRWAITATLRAQAKGSVGKPGAYFTSLLRRGAGPPPARGSTTAAPVPPAPATPPAEEPRPAGPAPAPPVVPRQGLSEADCARTWQAALIQLRVTLPADDYTRILRYAVLLELDRATGWALLGLPAGHMCAQVAGRLAGPIAEALGQVCGSAVRVTAAVLPGQGRLAGALPTLGDRLPADGPTSA